MACSPWQGSGRPGRARASIKGGGRRPSVRCRTLESISATAKTPATETTRTNRRQDCDKARAKSMAHLANRSRFCRITPTPASLFGSRRNDGRRSRASMAFIRSAEKFRAWARARWARFSRAARAEAHGLLHRANQAGGRTRRESASRCAIAGSTCGGASTASTSPAAAGGLQRPRAARRAPGPRRRAPIRPPGRRPGPPRGRRRRGRANRFAARRRRGPAAPLRRRRPAEAALALAAQPDEPRLLRVIGEKILGLELGRRRQKHLAALRRQAERDDEPHMGLARPRPRANGARAPQSTASGEKLAQIDAAKAAKGLGRAAQAGVQRAVLDVSARDKKDDRIGARAPADVLAGLVIGHQAARGPCRAA